MRSCLEVRAYTAVNINVPRVERGVTNEQMRERREKNQRVEGEERVCEGGGRVCGGLGAAW